MNENMKVGCSNGKGIFTVSWNAILNMFSFTSIKVILLHRTFRMWCTRTNLFKCLPLDHWKKLGRIGLINIIDSHKPQFTLMYLPCLGNTDLLETLSCIGRAWQWNTMDKTRRQARKITLWGVALSKWLSMMMWLYRIEIQNYLTLLKI